MNRQSNNGMSSSDELAELERELAQLKEQLPRHSISPSILARIDELEEEIAALRAT
ncbi:MAG: histidine kinase [Chloroflexi bacterium]|nr:histidine kinase [Chloroflexota bacterium]